MSTEVLALFAGLACVALLSVFMVSLACKTKFTEWLISRFYAKPGDVIGLLGQAKSGKDTFYDNVVTDFWKRRTMVPIRFADAIKAIAFFITGMDNKVPKKTKIVFAELKKTPAKCYDEIFLLFTEIFKSDDARSIVGHHIVQFLLKFVNNPSEEILKINQETKFGNPESITLGRLYQIIGKEFRDRVHPNVWIWFALKEVDRHLKMRPKFMKQAIDFCFVDVRLPEEANAIKKNFGNATIIKVSRPWGLRAKHLGDGRDPDDPTEKRCEECEFDFEFDNNTESVEQLVADGLTEMRKLFPASAHYFGSNSSSSSSFSSLS